MIGTVIKNRYRIEQKIGEGAMGKVFSATDLQQQHLVAIKSMSRDLAEQTTYQKRFAREVSTLNRLDHPNIIEFVDAFVIGGFGFLVMEYAGGGTFKDLLKREKQLAAEPLKSLFLPIVDAVHSAHQLGITHRDLKLQNILLTTDGQPKVADFGLAKVSGASTMTQSGTIFGTLAYMPPEAFEDARRQDHRGDIWALGVMLFELLTGTLPFKAETQMELVGAILSSKPRALHKHRPDLNPMWENVIGQCLQKDPERRYQSAKDLWIDIHTEQAGLKKLASAGVSADIVNMPLEEIFADRQKTPALEISILDSDGNTQEDFEFLFQNPTRRPSVEKVAKTGALRPSTPPPPPSTLGYSIILAVLVVLAAALVVLVVLGR